MRVWRWSLRKEEWKGNLNSLERQSGPSYMREHFVTASSAVYTLQMRSSLDMKWWCHGFSMLLHANVPLHQELVTESCQVATRKKGVLVVWFLFPSQSIHWEDDRRCKTWHGAASTYAALSSLSFSLWCSKKQKVTPLTHVSTSAKYAYEV